MVHMYIVKTQLYSL